MTLDIEFEIDIEIERLMAELTALAAISEPRREPGVGIAVTRVVFTAIDLKARAYVEELAHSAGMTIRHDAVGNTFFRWAGSEPDLPAVATGSHIDAIPNAGMYDGTVGVLGGLAAVRALKAAGFTPRRALEVILFTSEEPTRFGIGCLGSRVLSGTLTATDALALCDSEGNALAQVLSAANFNGPLESALLAPGAYAAFVELHIEQGPLLEQESIPLGIVTAIAAPASLRITVEGEGGHAGAMLMPVRHDALVAAAELIEAIEAAALATGAIDTVATVGMCDVFPGAVNSVPSRVTLSLDVRDIDQARRDSVLDTIQQKAQSIAARRGVHITHAWLNQDAPAASSPALIEAIAAAAAGEGIAAKHMVSRAYHDALFMARVAPVAMIFIPCRGGVSHRPDEYASPEAIAQGVRVLARTLASLSQ